MADVLLPPWLRIARLRTDYLDNTGMTRGLYTAAPETTGFGGDRLKLSLEFSPTATLATDWAVERATIRSFLASLRGRQNRAYVWDPSYRIRGSFPATELLSNNTFASGTTGWSSGSSINITISVQDRILRSLRVSSLSSTTVRATALTTVAYAPYIARAFVVNGRGTMAPHGARLGTSAGASDVVGTAILSDSGLSTAVGVAQGTTTLFSVLDSVTGRRASDFIDIPYTSVSRCALVDNGTNLLLQSDELDATWTATRASVDDQDPGVTDPIGTNTADEIIEDATASNTHLVSQNVTVSSSALDYSFACVLRAGARTWGRLALVESVSSHELVAYFDLGNGAVGSTVTVTGANWANARAYIQSLGNSWYYCVVVGRKASAATTLTARIGIATGDGTQTYTGDGTSSIYAWRATLAQSGVPTRLIQTTTTASTGTDQTGSALLVKGLPASTSGLLLPDDRFEVITSRGSELKIVTASLDSDAAGLGYLQFEPPLRGIPADNAPIIVVTPMTKAIFAGDMVGWDDSPGILTTASAEFEEAT
jgi:hypothetical protein